MDMIQILKDAVEQGASDIFVIAGLPVSYKIQGNIVRMDYESLTPAQTEKFVREIYKLAEDRNINYITLEGDDDFSFSIKGISRFRVNAYKQRGSLSAVIRVVTFELPHPHEIGIPDTILNLADRTKGLVLVTGPAGSGKSTTLACIIDRINKTRSAHVITLEDPLEFLHKHNKSIVSQREIVTDTESYVKALRAALRQSPDVILLGEMRDYETINVAMTAAETGHLIISTLHTIGVANTIDRIIDAFPPSQQHQIRAQLAMVLQAVVSQQLIPTVDGRVVPAFEIMLVNGAIRNMIRESKVHQIDTVIYSSANEGMLSMDASLIDLYQKGIIRDHDALIYSTNPDLMSKKIKNM
ncbi:PilT/PilU family type 4a pilus ATPase [Oscillospiraceae bacterium PP1C4]